MMQCNIVTWDEVGAMMADLRTIARGLLRSEKNAQTLQHPTALVQAALLRQAREQQNARRPGRLHKGSAPKLFDNDIDWEKITWENRETFLRYMHRSMQRLLIEKARQQQTLARRNTVVLVDDFDNKTPVNAAHVTPPLHMCDPSHLAEVDQDLKMMETFRDVVRGDDRLDSIQARTLECPDIMLAIHEALAALESHDEKLAIVLHLKMYTNLTFREIASFTNVPVGTVRHRLRRAINFVERTLESWRRPQSSEH